MITGAPTINGQTIVCSGSAVLNQNDIFEVSPVPSDTKFRARFLISYEENGDESIALEGEPQVAVIKISRKTSNLGNFGTASPMLIGVDEETNTDYFVSFAIDTFGKHDRHTTVLVYTFFSQPSPARTA